MARPVGGSGENDVIAGPVDDRRRDFRQVEPSLGRVIRRRRRKRRDQCPRRRLADRPWQ